MVKRLSLCGLIGLGCLFVYSLPLFCETNSTIKPAEQTVTQTPQPPHPNTSQPQTVEERILGQLTDLKTSAQTEYRISSADTLDISVWQIPDLSRPDVIVRPDGKISYPLIGDMPARGLSLTQLDEIITERLKRYVKDPQVSVMLRSMAGITAAGNRFVILGEVNRPGVYAYPGDIRIIEALALAGGVTDDSVRGDILIIRGDVNNPKTYSINIQKVLKKRHPDLSMNIPIQSQDIILVPRTLIANVNAFIRTMYPLISVSKDGLAARKAMIDAEREKW